MKVCLDRRLQEAYALTPPCVCCADIGTDHGLLPLALLAGGKVQQVVVSDISAKALQKAKTLLIQKGYSQQATFVVGDGVLGLPCEAQVVSILGMGGQTISHILRTGKEKLARATLLIGAQSDLFLVRETLGQLQYTIETETLVEEGKHMYVLMRAIPAPHALYSREACWLGPVLLQKGHPLFEKWLTQRKRCLAHAIQAMQKAGHDKDAQRLAQSHEEYGYVEKALQNIQKER